METLAFNAPRFEHAFFWGGGGGGCEGGGGGGGQISARRDEGLS